MKLPDYVPEQVISGALHYFRIHPGLWDDRLDKAVATGLNTVETYIPWNLHEPHQGELVFSGICDVAPFIRKAQAHQRQVIVRPGPYICAEWDNGGFPGWLLALPGVKLRCVDPVYLDAVEKYFTVLFDPLREIESEPAFYRGTFDLAETADTFVNRPGVKGSVWINGSHLGRYWDIGPTETLYVPAPVLRKGQNEIIILEQEKWLAPTITFTAEPNLGDI